MLKCSTVYLQVALFGSAQPKPVWILAMPVGKVIAAWGMDTERYIKALIKKTKQEESFSGKQSLTHQQAPAKCLYYVSQNQASNAWNWTPAVTSTWVIVCSHYAN